MKISEKWQFLKIYNFFQIHDSKFVLGPINSFWMSLFLSLNRIQKYWFSKKLHHLKLSLSYLGRFPQHCRILQMIASQLLIQRIQNVDECAVSDAWQLRSDVGHPDEINVAGDDGDVLGRTGRSGRQRQRHRVHFWRITNCFELW